MGVLAALGAQVGAGVVGGISNQVSYGLGEITGYNQSLRDDQLNQQNALTKQQQYYDFRAMDKQQQLAKDMFDYTSPSKRVQQLREAGLNPALMYGQGGAGGSTVGSGGIASGGGGKASDEAARRMNDISSMGMGIQLQKLASEVKVNEATAEKLKADAEKTSGVDTEYAQTNINKGREEISKLIQETNNTRLKNEYQSLMNSWQETENDIQSSTKENVIKLSEWNVKEIIQKTRQLTVNSEISEGQKNSLIEASRLELSNIIADTNVKNSNIKLNSEQLNKIKADTSKILQEASNLGIDEAVKQIELRLSENGINPHGGMIDSIKRTLFEWVDLIKGR